MEFSEPVALGIESRRCFEMHKNSTAQETHILCAPIGSFVVAKGEGRLQCQRPKADAHATQFPEKIYIVVGRVELIMASSNI